MMMCVMVIVCFPIGYMFGSMHQAGVVPSLLYLQKFKADGLFSGGTNIVYHKTYMPPKYLLQVSGQPM